jgi:hypothetical protein
MNLTSALHTSLLLLPDKFNEAQLFMTIASLSYTGDFRFVFLFLICCTPCVNFIFKNTFDTMLLTVYLTQLTSNAKY